MKLRSRTLLLRRRLRQREAKKEINEIKELEQKKEKKCLCFAAEFVAKLLPAGCVGEVQRYCGWIECDYTKGSRVTSVGTAARA